MDVGRLAELIERQAAEGYGTIITPVRKGQIQGGIGSSYRYTFDGWEIGYVGGGVGGEIAVGRTIAEAVEATLVALDEAEGEGSEP